MLFSFSFFLFQKILQKHSSQRFDKFHGGWGFNNNDKVLCAGRGRHGTDGRASWKGKAEHRVLENFYFVGMVGFHWGICGLQMRCDALLLICRGSDWGGAGRERQGRDGKALWKAKGRASGFRKLLLWFFFFLILCWCGNLWELQKLWFYMYILIIS